MISEINSFRNVLKDQTIMRGVYQTCSIDKHILRSDLQEMPECCPRLRQIR
jgi:hypothetical protein